MHTLTYCPEDNKLRLYVGRVSREDYDALRAAGFVSTPKQDCDFVATWTPQREDLACEFLGDDEDIGDEDYSPEERAADRAERFAGYREKRSTEAIAAADRFGAGPVAFGHQSRARAARQAKRHDSHRTRALSQWSKAEYWQQRTADVISHALYKSSPEVRRGRILALEAEQRKHESGRAEYAAWIAGWEKVAAMEGADEVLPISEGHEFSGELNPAQRLAYSLANQNAIRFRFWHPTSESANSEAKRIWNHGFSAYDFLTMREFISEPFAQLSPRRLALMLLQKCRRPDDTTGSSFRWSEHYNLRLSYERAMLGANGGCASAVAMIPGGWIGRAQIQKVNKSPVTGRVVSVGLIGPHPWKTNRDGTPKVGVFACNIERMAADAYRAPTAEELAAFKAEQNANKKPSVPLINPTDEDAERLQALLNSQAAANSATRDRPAPEPRKVERVTQAKFSAYSGADSLYKVREFTLGGVTFKVRCRSRGWDYAAAYTVLILTDKPQKSLPAAAFSDVTTTTRELQLIS